jgi:hypothetical protein
VSSDQAEQWSLDIALPTVTRTGSGFRGRMAGRSMGDRMSLYRWWTAGSVRAVRTEKMSTRATGNDSMIFCMRVAGPASQARQNGRVTELAAGNAALYEARRPWELITRSGQCLTFQFSRDLLPLRRPELADSCARLLDSRSPSVRLLTGYLKEFDECAADLSVVQLGDAGHAAIDLLVMALRGVVPAAPAAGGQGETVAHRGGNAMAAEARRRSD